MPETLTEWQRVRAVAWYAKDLTVDDIAIILGRSAIIVATALQLVGAQAPTRTTKQGERDAEYREGFAAGYRSALCHVRLHGLGAAHEYSRHDLLPWRKEGGIVLSGKDAIPPEFLRRP